MFHEHLTSQEVEALYKNIRENQWRKLTDNEYASLIRFNMAYLKHTTLDIKLNYYVTYLTRAIAQTQDQPQAQGRWLGIEKNLLVVCKDLAKTIEDLKAENNAKNNTAFALSSLAPAA